jgi:hypothetical protein
MEEEKIIADIPVSIGEIKLIPIVEVLTHRWIKKGRAAYSVVKEPLAVVIVSQSEKKAFDMNGQEINIDELINAVSELKELL